MPTDQPFSLSEWEQLSNTPMVKGESKIYYLNEYWWRRKHANIQGQRTTNLEIVTAFITINKYNTNKQSFWLISVLWMKNNQERDIQWGGHTQIERGRQTERIDRARDSRREQREEGGISLSQGKALMFPSAVSTDTHISTSAPQMSNTGTVKGQGTPSPSTSLYVWVHV